MNPWKHLQDRARQVQCCEMLHNAVGKRNNQGWHLLLHDMSTLMLPSRSIARC